jgi:hypothetical protein
VAITVDTSRALRKPLDLTALVEAVVNAGPADESFWIEWKSDLDLTMAPGAFNTARTILGFANRMPDTAATVCEGLAYMIIGAQPGKVAGTIVIDGANLEQALIKYLGGDGPVWSPHYVTAQGRDVLVIVVEAPKWGDDIHALRTGFNNVLEGTVFVRSQAKTRQANAEEHKLLQQRLLRRQQSTQLGGLQVGFTIGPPHSVVVLDPTPEQVDDWVDERRAAIRAWHQAVIDATEEPNKGILASLFRPKIDEQAIEEHLQLCRQRVFDATRRALIEGGFSLLSMKVTTPGPRIFENVELTLTIDTPHSAFEERDAPADLESLPPPPKPPKKITTGDVLGISTIGSALVPSFLRTPLPKFQIPDTRIYIEDDLITLTIGRLRPEKPVTSTGFHIFLHERRQDQLPIAWTLTSTSAQGVQRGTTEVPVLPRQAVLLLSTKDLPETPETD